MIASIRSTSASRVLDLRLRLVALRGEARDRRDRRIEVALALLEGLLGDEAGLHQFLPAPEVGLGELERALPRGDLRFRRRRRVLGALHARLRCAKLRLDFGRRDPRDHLALRDGRAFLDGDLLETAGVFRRHVDLGRLDAPVRLDDASRQPLAAKLSDQVLDQALGVSGRHERHARRPDPDATKPERIRVTVAHRRRDIMTELRRFPAWSERALGLLSAAATSTSQHAVANASSGVCPPSLPLY